MKDQSRSYTLRLDGERCDMTQAEAFHALEHGSLDARLQLWVEPTSEWVSFLPLVQVAYKDAKARGRIYDVAQGDRRFGPFTKAEVIEQYGKSLTALYWTNGMTDWAKTSDLANPPKPAPAASAPAAPDAEPKRRIVMSRTGVPLVKAQRNYGVFVLLGLAGGLFGLHSFYAGRVGRGFVYMLASLFGALVIAIPTTEHDQSGKVFFGCLILFVVELCTFVEIAANRLDVDGDPYAGCDPQAPQ